MSRVALYFGSFNPVHNGHTAVAEFVVSQSGLCDELWFVVSPQNPLKPSGTLAPDTDRLKMTEIAVEEELRGSAVSVCDVEFRLPRPSYTIDTLRALGAEFTQHTFSVVVGGDIIGEIERWKEYETLLAEYQFLAYPREGYSVDKYIDRVVYLKYASKWGFSSTDIRSALARGESVEGMVSKGVAKYIVGNGLYSADSQIDALSAAINSQPSNTELYFKRGRLNYGAGRFDKALNDFLKVGELDPQNAEAQQYARQIKEIFEFRYKDYYNP